MEYIIYIKPTTFFYSSSAPSHTHISRKNLAVTAYGTDNYLACNIIGQQGAVFDEIISKQAFGKSGKWQMAAKTNKYIYIYIYIYIYKEVKEYKVLNNRFLYSEVQESRVYSKADIQRI